MIVQLVKQTEIFFMKKLIVLHWYIWSWMIFNLLSFYYLYNLNFVDVIEQQFNISLLYIKTTSNNIA